MGNTLRLSPVMFADAMRFAMVMSCAMALIAAGRFAPF